MCPSTCAADTWAMKRYLIIGYGAAAYLLFLVAFLYLVGFVGNSLVPRTVDHGLPAPIGQAVLVNVLLVGAFGLQHSVMARPAFKAWWTRLVPQSIERSTYVVLSSAVLVLLYWQWRTMPAVIWDVRPAGGARGGVGAFLAGLGDRAGLDLHGQPLRPVRPSAGVSGMARKTLYPHRLSRALPLPSGTPPTHARFPHRLLGSAHHDGRTPALLVRHDGLHPDRRAARRAQSGSGAGRPIP